MTSDDSGSDFSPWSGGGGERATRDILDSEHRYRALFDALDEGFCIIRFIDGPDGPLSDYVHVEANPAYERHAGIPNVVGQKVHEMVPAEAAEWVKIYGRVLETGEQIRFERELAATGRELELSAIRLEPPNRNEVAVIFRDVTERNRAQRALRELNDTLESRIVEAVAERQILADVVEGSAGGVQVVDLDLRLLATNAASAIVFERVFGARPKPGDSLIDLMAGREGSRERGRDLWMRAIAGEHFVHVVTFPAVDGIPQHYEIRFSPLRDATGAIIGAYQFSYDVSARHAEQERLAKAEEALRQAQKMEAVGQLTGGIAHDFNNLLAGITGAFEMIRIRLESGRSGEAERYLSAGLGAARRAAALTHRLLAFSRKQTLSPKPLVANRLIADMVELIQRTVGPGIAVEHVAASALWPSLVDANQLENALLNLCINARDAMPAGGRIMLETGNRWIDARTAEEQGLKPGQYVSICVSDTGVGIAKDMVERVFEPFFTTKPIGEGTGLGLSMVYGFARQSGGQVRIYSEIGEGTMVCIYLPRHLGETDGVEETATTISATGQLKGDILVVDDEAIVRMLVVDTLEDAGFTCLEAGSGPEALKVLEAAGSIDLLVTDVGLPGGLNGRQVADAARERVPGLKVLFITGYAENAVLNHGHVEPGMEVLTKPFAVDELRSRVQRILGPTDVG